MFKKIKLVQELKKINDLFFVLPNGLFKMNNDYVLYSDLVVRDLPYPMGQTLKIKQEQIKKLKTNFRDIHLLFQEAIVYQSREFESINVRELSLPIILGEIEKMNFSIKKNPYENYLEVTVLKFLMESLNNSKALLGGVWSPGRYVASNVKRFGTTYAHFARNIGEKNKIIAYLREKIMGYPDHFIEHVQEFKLQPFNRNNSQYSTFLEYRLIQIRYKIFLQEVCLHSYYLTDETKRKYDDLMQQMKELLTTYPVIKK